jgi:murein DD-endopeptidase MepM/ murein hydrolase activator NlpD
MPFVSKVKDNIITVEAELRSGSNLNDLLVSEGVSRDDAASVVFEVSPYLNLRNLKAGELFTLEYNNNEFSGFSMMKSKDMIIQVVRDLTRESGFRVEEKERVLKTYISNVSGTIEGSLYNSALNAGMSSNILMDLIKLLSYDVDFQRDIQAGDTFQVAFETIFDEDGQKVDDGKILCAQLHTDGREVEFYNYTDLNGDSDYYNNDGQTIRKTLLKTPINGAYITSGYGMRISPITGFSKKHTGIDFGAPAGTPIYASGDGVIEEAYYSQVYGNFIQLRHTNGYGTLYGHMTSYARGMRKGVRVKQGQVIGYVGSTGMSTGPHLHYEVIYWGTKVNPSSVKSPPGRTLKDEDLILFENLKKSYIASFL